MLELIVEAIYTIRNHMCIIGQMCIMHVRMCVLYVYAVCVYAYVRVCCICM